MQGIVTNIQSFIFTMAPVIRRPSISRCAICAASGVTTGDVVAQKQSLRVFI
jgi:hypothetical protein